VHVYKYIVLVKSYTQKTFLYLTYVILFRLVLRPRLLYGIETVKWLYFCTAAIFSRVQIKDHCLYNTVYCLRPYEYSVNQKTSRNGISNAKYKNDFCLCVATTSLVYNIIMVGYKIHRSCALCRYVYLMYFVSCFQTF
jgi:hypothetical protein